MAYQSEIEKLAQRFDEKPEQWFAALADAYRKAGDLEQALAIVEAWVEKRPNYASGYIVLGRCLVDAERDPEASAAFERVLSLDAENIIAIRALSDIAQRSGDLTMARRWLQRLLEVDPMNEEAEEALQALSAEAPEDMAVAVEDIEPEYAPAEEPASIPVAGLEPTAVGDAGPDVAKTLEEEAIVLEAEQPTPESLTPAAGPDEEIPELEEADETTLETPAIRLDAVAQEPSPEPAAGPRTGEHTIDLAEEPEEEPFVVVPEVSPTAPTLEITGARASSEDAAGVEPPDVGAGDIVVTSFDEGLGWDAGERVSKAISAEELAEAREAHADDLEPTAYDTGAEELEVEPAVPEPAEAGEPALDAAAPAEPTPVPAAPALSEAATLPLIMPESVVAAGEAGDDAEPVVTETMGEVYATQGLFDKAVGVYRALLEREPDNAAFRARLEELEGQAGQAVPSRPSRPAAGRFSVLMTGGQSAESMLQELLARGGAPPAAPAAGPDGPSPMESAFEGESPEAPGAPTVPATDEVSLASLFGDAAPPVPVPDRLPADGAPVARSGPTFDTFFGTPPRPSEAQEAEAPDDADESDSDFQDWLKGLKT